MCSEDLFEGWLSVPAMESLFAFESQPSQYDAYNTIAEPRFQTDVAIELMHPAGGVPDRLPVGSDSVGAADLASLPLPTPPQALPEAATSSSNGRKRRGHTKSRLGCIGCKKRKIKVSAFRHADDQSLRSLVSRDMAILCQLYSTWM